MGELKRGGGFSIEVRGPDGKLKDALYQRRTEKGVVRKGVGDRWGKVPPPRIRRLAQKLVRERNYEQLKKLLQRERNPWLEREVEHILSQSGKTDNLTRKTF